MIDSLGLPLSSGPTENVDSNENLLSSFNVVELAFGTLKWPPFRDKTEGKWFYLEIGQIDNFYTHLKNAYLASNNFL